MKRFLPISILAIGLLIAVYFDLHAYLSLDRLSEYYGLLKTDIQHQYFITICILASVYIVTVTFSIPGASVLSLLYGALLGTWVSGTLVVFAATFGLDPTGYETSNGVFRIYYTKFPETKGGDYVLGRGTLIYTAAASKNPTITAPSSGAKKTINCIKGKTTKKVSGANPKCPKGFKRK